MKVTIEHFSTVKIIGRGAFGEVRVVKKNDDREVYAMKTMLKKEMIDKNQVEHIKAERDPLSAYGVLWRWGPNDNPHARGYSVRETDAVLFVRACMCYTFRARA